MMDKRRHHLVGLGLVLAAVLSGAACGEEEQVVLGPEFQALGKVGPDGGRLCSGMFCLDVPKGALAQTVEVRARLVSPGAGRQGITIRGLVYELTAATTVFLKPVTLELPRPDGFYESELRVLSREGSTTRWSFSYGEAIGEVIRVQTGHLSQWAAAEVEGVWLAGIGVDPQGRVYAADLGGKRFVRINAVTDAPSAWEPLKTGGNLVKPWDVAVTPGGKILLADWGFAGMGLVDDVTGKGLKALYGADNVVDKIHKAHLVFAPSSGGFYVGHKIFDSARASDLTGMSSLKTGIAGGTLRGAAEAKGTVYLAASQVNGANNNAIVTDGPQGAKVYLGQQLAALNKIGALRGIAVDKLGQIYLGDRDKCAVTRLDDLQGKGEQVIWSQAGCAVEDLAMGPASTLYISTSAKVFKVQLDLCPTDTAKIEPGLCGCGTVDTDTDGDKTPDCKDLCPSDKAKIAPGLCGCGTADTDTDGDKTPDCKDLCASDKAKTAPGICGCGTADTDTDGDGLLDCKDTYPSQGCSCFKLSALKAARAVTGAKCLKDDKLLYATATYNGVVEEYTNTASYYAALLTGVQLDTAFGSDDYYCGAGCYENPSGYGTKCVGKKSLVWNTLKSKTEYQACLELISAACK